MSDSIKLTNDLTELKTFSFALTKIALSALKTVYESSKRVSKLLN